ncbi:hypothetical protein [Streptomyces sp. NBC_01803]|uniref:hypothetical protein n=1 Tax=Streptomyces sp. NBC_01803 TaxID=2975946 RepID=UPI002DD8E4E5|nr:hypothetical protein [Streptomyces sp. NBC_01803]WSA46125.1 hypothetical protein OIE51_19175 [Streptomyces sp. NBC_01803]
MTTRAGILAPIDIDASTVRPDDKLLIGGQVFTVRALTPSTAAAAAWTSPPASP